MILRYLDAAERNPSKWSVYSLCKALDAENELFHSYDTENRVQFIALVTTLHLPTIREGVAEFESVPQHNHG